MSFDCFIGIDYSGASTPENRLPGLQVCVTHKGRMPHLVKPSSGLNWTRREIADWLLTQIRDDKRFIVGIDYNFSFPKSYFHRYKLENWDQFLTDFSKHWPTHKQGVTVEEFRAGNQRTGAPTKFRLTEKWTSSAKSVFRFDVQGQVAKSAHAGIPWLQYIRERADNKVHFWPFDGFTIEEGKSVIAETYPSIFRNRYERAGRTVDEQDAYSIAVWLEERDRKDKLCYYLNLNTLTSKEKKRAKLEGWILGVC